jgi:hypothetical protein
MSGMAMGRNSGRTGVPPSEASFSAGGDGDGDGSFTLTV